MVFYSIIPAPKCSLDTVDRDKSREPNLRVFKLPHGGVGINRGDRVAPDNPPDVTRSKKTDPMTRLGYGTGRGEGA